MFNAEAHMYVDANMAPRILLVDAEEALLRSHARALRAAGFRVETARDVASALRALTLSSFDVVLSDIVTPGINGLLERVSAHNLDVPGVLIAGAPTMETAIAVLNRRAVRYLIKPVELRELLKVTGDAVRLHRIAKAQRQAIDTEGDTESFSGDLAGSAARFRSALQSLYLDYQPIVSWSKKRVFAYEALVRSREPGLASPGPMFAAARRLGALHELGRTIRDAAIAPLGRLADEVLLCINLHPGDLLDERLFAGDSPFAAVAHRVVLEITERESLHEVQDIRARVDRLRKLGFRIAVDDLGAGYAGLTSLALLDPEIVKIDLALVRNVHREPTKQMLVRTIVTMCGGLGITVAAEGIETGEERAALTAAGCDLMQGYLFARPGEAFVASSF